MYLERNIDSELMSWKEESGRKPLIVRGARQVGKSSSIRKLGESFELLFAIVTKSLWIFQSCNFQCIDKVY